ncbi:hypothetical protein LCGC14_1813160 [marine sediment metagenome]|uniref:Uncharacterized protein n=1 Tax=marine sediment metagenome TaxID=412755 RepID=A0A0F9GL95_9ZZZZ
MNNRNFEIEENIEGEFSEFLCSVPDFKSTQVIEAFQKYLSEHTSSLYRKKLNQQETSIITPKKISYLSIFSYLMKKSISNIEGIQDSLKIKFDIQQGYRHFFTLFLKDEITLQDLEEQFELTEDRFLLTDIKAESIEKIKSKFDKYIRYKKVKERIALKIYFKGMLRYILEAFYKQYSSAEFSKELDNKRKSLPKQKKPLKVKMRSARAQRYHSKIVANK